MTNQLVKDIAYRINRNNELQFVTKPEIYRLSSKDDINGFKTLLEQNPQLEVCDTLYQQLKELIKIKYLSKANSPQEIEDLVTTHLNNVPLEEYGVWVYYPWLNKVVHTLDEEEFIQVRTNRNQHKITWSELFLLRSKKIGIVGLSVGQTIAFTIVLERCCGEIRLADFDDIELSNLNRLKTGLHNLGMQKIVQVAREIAELDPFIKVICYNQGITENNIDDFLLKDGKLDLLIEECDGLDIKIVSRIKAKQYGIPVVMETNDRGMVDIERYDLDPSYPMLHNIVGDVVVEQLKNLTTEQKVPLMMKLVGFNTVSPRGKATLIELGQTLSTWPQLASSVVLGGGVVTDVARRILLNQLSVSGRFYVDVERIINNPKSAAPAYAKPTIAALTVSVMEQIADINMLLISMLKCAHINADPVILSTRDNGLTNVQYPIMDKFNYIVCKTSLDGKNYFLDATHHKIGFGKLPLECYNGHAQVICENTYPVFLIPDSLKETKITSIYVYNDSTNKMSIDYNSTPGYYESYKLRTEINTEKPTEYFKEISKSYITENSISTSGIDSPNNYDESLNIHYSMQLEQGNPEIIYFNPMFTEAIKENPFKSDSLRNYSVEMPYTTDNIYSFNMEMPQGYTIDELPKPVKIMLNNNEGMFEYAIKSVGNRIQLRSRVSFSKATFYPEDYQSLRNFYTLIVNKQSEFIVLRRLSKK